MIKNQDGENSPELATPNEVSEKGPKNTLDYIDDLLQAARDLRPDLWERTEQIARIIDLSGFLDGWVWNDEESQALSDARNDCRRSIAMGKAQEVLRYLGVNTDQDWMEIIQTMAKNRLKK